MTLLPDFGSMLQASPVDLTVLEETSKWRAREVQYLGGTWSQLRSFIPEFEFHAFTTGNGEPENPFYRTVVRRPLSRTERAMPVGIVSMTYSLVQHRDLGDRCMEALQSAGIDTSALRCEVGLSEFGEWMNLRIYLPESYSFTPSDKHKLNLRLEVFNSVDGSSRVTILLGWYRLVCSNGLVIGTSLVQLSDLHNSKLDLQILIQGVEKGIRSAKRDAQTLNAMENKKLILAVFKSWIENTLAKKWGKKAACRAFHICTTGYDAEVLPCFENLSPVELPVRRTERVRGAPVVAANVYDVCQALSWIATRRPNAEQRVEWQRDIVALVRPLMEFRAIEGAEPLL